MLSESRNLVRTDPSDRDLANRIMAVLAGLALAVIAATIYAAFAMNASALGIESGIIHKEIDRVVLKTLDEQKSVALWDEAVERISARDNEWLENEIGSYLAGTYGHDQVFVFDGKGDMVYRYNREGVLARAGPAIGAARSLLVEVWGGRSRGWFRRDGKFLTLQASEDQLAGASKLRAGANVLEIGGRAAVVSAMTVTPTHDLRLLNARPSVILSVIYLTPERLARMGEDVNIQNLRLLKQGAGRQEGLIEMSADDGQPIGSLVWTPQHPGRAFITVLLPAILIVTFAGVFASRFLIGRMTTLGDKLRLSAETAHRLALEDQLSSLPNRRAFHSELEERCVSVARPFLVAVLDLDRFKEVNDTFGHETGDRLIGAVGGRLRNAIGNAGMVARLGGDEFAVIADGAEISARQFKRTLGKVFEGPFQLGPYRLSASASIGVCAVQDDKVTPTRILRDADTALYEAKARGRRQAVIYSPELSHALRGRRVVERDLQDAIDNDGLYLAFQPVVSLGGDGSAEVEALVRWKHPILGDLSPDQFVPVAEQSDMIVALGRAVFRLAIRELIAWPDLRMSVNISPRELRSGEFLKFVRDACRAQGIAANRITFEVTEGIAIDDSGKASLILQSLRAMGFRVALDDFGTGYASLSFLRTYPLDRVKLDRTLLTGAGSEQAATAVFEGAISIGRKLGLETVAEGVESDEQMAIARKAGCTHAQGYRISAPLGREEIGDFFGWAEHGARVAGKRRR